ncbi:MaoC family dehydratase N-terminal domain-containing protein [Rhizobiaceae bacterium]|nr:MaoC family dehydratase N-terminal domain-containing protein [Rhizobiaceae bacterium]
MSDYADWIGRTRESESVLDAERTAWMAAALGVPAPTDVLPALWHWAFHAEAIQPADTGGDGHERLGAFMPPIPAKRRMFAGGEFIFHAPLHVGMATRLVRRVVSVDAKDGATGPFHLVRVAFELSGDNGPLVTETRTIAYLPTTGGPRSGKPAPFDAELKKTIVPDTVQLFRFSAATGNSHRIHYDQPYATGTEGYPGIVIHGPLQAMALAALAEAHTGAPLATFTFRALAPPFIGDTLTLGARREGDVIALQSTAQDGIATMKATATT